MEYLTAENSFADRTEQTGAVFRDFVPNEAELCDLLIKLPLFDFRRLAVLLFGHWRVFLIPCYFADSPCT